MELWQILLCNIIILLFLNFLIKTRLTKTARLANLFPGEVIVPFLGNTKLFLGSYSEVPNKLSKYVKKFGRCCVFWKFDTPWIIIADAGLTEKILSSTKHIDKGKEYDMITFYMGSGLLSGPPEKWRRERKILNPAFKQPMSEGFLNSFNEQSTILIDLLNDKFTLGLGSTTMKIAIVHEIGQCTLGLAMETVLGKKTDLQRTSDPDKRRYLRGLLIIVEAIRVRVSKPWLLFPVIWDLFGMGRIDLKTKNFLRRALCEMIEERKAVLTNETLKNGSIEEETTQFKFKPYMDVLLTTEETSEDIENLIDHGMNFMGAGSETAATAMQFTLFLLATYPKTQIAIQKELTEIFKGDKLREITPEDLLQMNFLEMTIKEAMRLYPPIPWITRRIHSDIPLDNGLTVPKGSDAVFILYDLHRDPNVFPDPEAFQPERFSTKESASRNFYTYLPFAAGTRNCIGHKYAMVMMKVILAKLLWNFEFQTDMKREDLKLMYGITLEVNPIIFKIRRRQHNSS